MSKRALRLGRNVRSIGRATSFEFGMACVFVQLPVEPTGEVGEFTSVAAHIDHFAFRMARRTQYRLRLRNCRGFVDLYSDRRASAMPCNTGCAAAIELFVVR